VIPLKQPAVVDMQRFTGLYFPGFVTEHADLNRELVRLLQFEFRRLGYQVVQGELSQWPAWEWISRQNFAGQSALVVTGEVALRPYTASGVRTQVRRVLHIVHQTALLEIHRSRGLSLACPLQSPMCHASPNARKHTGSPSVSAHLLCIEPTLP